MSKLIDLSGQRFGRLTVIERTEKESKGQARWLCRCDCGNTAIVQSYDLRSGNTQSCGCQRKEHFTHFVHGHSKERIYAIWKGMKSRCFNKNRKHYKDYGGRGITVCQEWKDDFESFYEWSIANGYSDDLSIDRINSDGNYEPSNCRWADGITQGNNKTNNAVIEFNGVAHTLSEWAGITGIKYATLYSRIVVYGWTAEKALTTK